MRVVNRRAAGASIVVAAMTLVGAGWAGSAPASAGPVSGGGRPAHHAHHPAPTPEPIKVSELPLPPTAPSSSVGSCSNAVNPHATGCIDSGPAALFSGGFLPDGHEISATITYAGAPASPLPASVYSGSQLSMVKTDGKTFSNGDAWKCVTCGVPAANAQGINGDTSYPQPFRDGKRVLWGTNIVDCAPFLLTSDACTPARVHIYPIFWQTKTDPSAGSGNLRELRLHPDQVHLGFNHIVLGPVLGEWGYFGRLVFDASPTIGTPLVPRYDITAVTTLYNARASQQPWRIDPKHPTRILFNPLSPDVGEFRGFTKDGKEALYIGNPAESDNIDLFATNLRTGRTRRVTSNPEYTDPEDVSPNSKWVVVLDTRGSGRMLFLSAMRGIPPFNDMVTAAAVSSVRNNGQRRFFQPYLIDRYGDRGAYQGQQLNAGNKAPGSVSDPNWNAMADPRWSPDGTSVAYWQALVTSPSCGGANPLPCPVSTEPGGRRVRLMIAHLTSRKPSTTAPVRPVSDKVPWGTPFTPAAPSPTRAFLPAGTYTLIGKKCGSAVATITLNAAKNGIGSVAVTYKNFSDDGRHIINGTESVSGSGVLTQHIVWHSDLHLSGVQTGTKLTSANGFDLLINLENPEFQATGTLTTTIGNTVYRQPANNT